MMFTFVMIAMCDLITQLLYDNISSSNLLATLHLIGTCRVTFTLNSDYQFSMSYKIYFFILLVILQFGNHGQAAPVLRKQDSSTKLNTITENDLLEGDMIIDQTVWNIVTNQSAETKRSAVTNGVNLWPKGIVPYRISSELSSYANYVIRQAIGRLHTSTCIRFTLRTNEYHFVEFIKSNGCYSYVGRQAAFGRQVISLGSGCETVGTALHEMVHALGFFHTSSRTDRDSYVIVYDYNIAAGKDRNFQKYTHGQIDHLNTPYDITSIMHLPRDAFAKAPNLITIQARAGAHIKLGETGELSPIDKHQLNALYKCPSVTSASSCLAALGVQNKAIPDKAMKASSYEKGFKPSQGRLHKTPSSVGMGAWCPTTYTNSWLQVDLGADVRVTGIATQGYEDMFRNTYYAPRYDIKYKTSGRRGWLSYTSACTAYSGIQGLPGNWDGLSVQYNALTPTLNARYVRLYPKSSNSQPCLRVEFYGCKV